MTRDRLFALTATLCCLLAFGATAGAMEDAMETTPDEAIDIERELIPISTGELRDLKEQSKSVPPADGSRAGESQRGTTVKPGESGEARSNVAEEKTEEKRRDAGAGETTDREQSDDAGEKTRQARTETVTSAATVRPPTLWEQLLWLLRRGLAALLGVLPYVALLVAAVLLVRRTDVLGRIGGASGEPTGETGTPAAGPDPLAPETEVSQLWLRMVRRFDLADDPTKTPAERAAAAVEAGADPTGVKLLTGAFEEVRYGGREASEELRRRARDGYKRLGDTGEAESP